MTDTFARQLVNSFLGPYQLSVKLAEGGTGLVYLGQTPQGGNYRQVVVKVLRPELAKDRHCIDGFGKEFATLESLIDQPGYPRAIRYDTVRDLPAFAMEHIDGPNILQMVRDGVVFSRLSAFMSMVKLVAVLHHQEIIHGDIKPSNYLLRSEDGKMHLIDFGNVSKPQKSGLTTAFIRRKVKHVRGTPAYMAPELLDKNRPSFRSDVFSLGVCAKVLFTNRRLTSREDGTDKFFKNQTKTRASVEERINVPQLGDKVNTILSYCIRSEPEARPENAVDLFNLLKQNIDKRQLKGPDRLSRFLAQKAKEELAREEQERKSKEEALRQASEQASARKDGWEG